MRRSVFVGQFPTCCEFFGDHDFFPRGLFNADDQEIPDVDIGGYCDLEIPAYARAFLIKQSNRNYIVFCAENVSGSFVSIERIPASMLFGSVPLRPEQEARLRAVLSLRPHVSIDLLRTVLSRFADTGL